MKILFKFNKAIRYLSYFLKDNGLFSLLIYFLFRVLKKEKLLKIKVNNTDIFIRPNSHDLSVAFQTLYEEYELLRFVSVPKSGALIIDAGGYIGTASIALSKIFPQAIVLSIEPSSKNFNILEQNVFAYKNIIPINAALVKTLDKKSIQLKDRGTGQWGFSISSRVSDAESMEIVDCCTLDSLLDKFDFQNIFILKLDIEGYEAELFENCEDWIEKTSLIYIELHDRIDSRCSINFFNATTGRLTIKADSEKYLSVGKSTFYD